MPRVAASRDQASGVGSDVTQTDDKAGRQLSIRSKVEVDGEGTPQTCSDPGYVDLLTDVPALRIERLAAEYGVGVPERIDVLRPVTEDRG